MTEDAATEDAVAEAYERGLAAERTGDIDGAAAAFLQALQLDPADHGGVSVRLAAMGRGAVPDKAPDAYVATLFDQHAEAFDDILVEQLGYAVPLMVRDRLQVLAPGPYRRVLDLGCGTGLTGQALADMAGEITGVDLAETMLEMTDDRGVYDDLYIAEAVTFLTEAPDEPWDLITATDVLPYMGALEEFFAEAARCLKRGGVLALSSESLPGQTRDYIVGARHRFAHSQAYLHRLMAANGFDVIEMTPITVRLEDENPVPGHLIVARRA